MGSILASVMLAVASDLKPSMDCIAVMVDGTIQTGPFAFDLHIGLVWVPFSRDLRFRRLKHPSKYGAEMQNPVMHS